MKEPIVPIDEKQRLEALHALGALDSVQEPRFRKYVDFAAREFGVPVAAISLIDRQRQVFKASIGLNICETPRAASFCGHAILEKSAFVIENALQDRRFADNPLVTGAPFIRFYAGAPLVLASGYAIGSLCLIDFKPRELGETPRQILTVLADLIARELQQASIPAG